MQKKNEKKDSKRFHCADKIKKATKKKDVVGLVHAVSVFRIGFAAAHAHVHHGQPRAPHQHICCKSRDV